MNKITTNQTISMFLLIFAISFLMPQIAKAELVQLAYARYIGTTDDKIYEVNSYKCDISGEKFSEIIVDGKTIWKCGWHQPNGHLPCSGKAYYSVEPIDIELSNLNDENGLLFSRSFDFMLEGKDHVEHLYKCNISGEKFSEIIVDGKIIWKCGWSHCPNDYDSADNNSADNNNPIDIELLIGLLDNEFVFNNSGSMVMVSQSSSPFDSGEGVEKNDVNMNYRINNNFLEIKCQKDIFINVADQQTGQVIVSDIFVKGNDGWHTINVPFNIDKTRAYTIVAMFNGQVVRTLSFYFN